MKIFDIALCISVVISGITLFHYRQQKPIKIELGYDENGNIHIDKVLKVVFDRNCKKMNKHWKREIRRMNQEKNKKNLN